MALASGARLGPYEILSPLGSGGMGEVYRAHDTKLGRDVAIKVLPEAFAHDPDRLARFQREAKMLALTLQLLSCFIVIEHGRRMILHRQRDSRADTRVRRATTAGCISRRWSASLHAA